MRATLAAVTASAIAFFATQASAFLVLTIDDYTADTLALTISGTLDAATTGDYPGYLAIKNDWSNNIGVHTEMFTKNPTIQSNTVLIGGGGYSAALVASNGSAVYNDSLYFYLFPNTLSLPAGTTVSGSIVLTGNGIFDPSDADTLQLVSGWNVSTGDWARLESGVSYAAAIPLPASGPLLCLGIAGLVRRRRRHTA